MSKAEDFVRKHSFVCDSKFHHLLMVDALEAVRIAREEEKKKMANFVLDDQLKCAEELKAEAFARGRLEAGKEIFNKIDKLNEETEECKYFFRGLEDLKTRFLSVSKEKVKK